MINKEASEMWYRFLRLDSFFTDDLLNIIKPFLEIIFLKDLMSILFILTFFSIKTNY